MRTKAKVTQLEEQWDWDPDPSMFDFKRFFWLILKLAVHTLRSQKKAGIVFPASRSVTPLPSSLLPCTILGGKMGGPFSLRPHTHGSGVAPHICVDSRPFHLCRWGGCLVGQHTLPFKTGARVCFQETGQLKSRCSFNAWRNLEKRELL